MCVYFWLPGGLKMIEDTKQRNYFMKYEPSTLKQSVSATIPISMRREGEEDIFNPLFFGNNFSQAQLNFPLEIEDPMDVFRHVKSQIDVIKVSPEPRVRLALIHCFTSCAAPQSLLAAALMDQFGRVTATLSNVIGPMQEVGSDQDFMDTDGAYRDTRN